MVAAVHLTLRCVWPTPVANEFLRGRASAACRSSQPSVLLVGDSRVQLGVDDGLLNRRLGLPAGSVANLALPSGDTTVFMAMYREFGSRFAPRPIIVLGISFFTVSDGASETLTDELLWSLDIADRRALVPSAQALTDVFLPEKFLWLRWSEPMRKRFPTKVMKFARIMPAAANMRAWQAIQGPGGLSRVRQIWFNDPQIDGVRWNQLEENLRTLLRQDVQLVLLEQPYHPCLEASIEGTEDGAINERYYLKVHRLANELGIPLLRYEIADLGAGDIDAIYMDPTHLNELGAALLTDRLARDLSGLLASGRVLLPDPTGPAPGRSNAVAQADGRN